MRVLGVDPGVSGAMAMLDTAMGGLYMADMPAPRVKGRRQINEGALGELIRVIEPDFAWIERVHSMPKQGVTSSFSFGLSYGLVRGILAALEVPTQLVTPQEWKRMFRVGADKNEARIVACRIFPSAAGRFTNDGRAEAALIALFGMQQLDPVPIAKTAEVIPFPLS